MNWTIEQVNSTPLYGTTMDSNEKAEMFMFILIMEKYTNSAFTWESRVARNKSP